MIEELTFQYCRSDSISHVLRLFVRDDKWYVLELGYGRNGLYLDGEWKKFVIEEKVLNPLNMEVEKLKIYHWGKGYPAWYIPKNRFMGVCDGTWSLDFKQTEKKVCRHIYGQKGYFPHELKTLLDLLTFSLIPDEDVCRWKFEELFDNDVDTDVFI